MKRKVLQIVWVQRAIQTFPSKINMSTSFSNATKPVTHFSQANQTQVMGGHGHEYGTWDICQV